MPADWTTIAVAGLGAVGTLGGYRVARASSRDETERLRVQYREDERRNRQNVYHRMLSLFAALDTWARNPQATADQFEALVSEFDFLHGGVLLFGDEGVIETLDPLIDGLQLIAAGTLGPQNQVARRQAAYNLHSAAFIQAQGALSVAMRADLDRALPR